MLEMIIKLLGLGPKLYVHDKFNVFDMIIIFFSSTEIILTYSTNSP